MPWAAWTTSSPGTWYVTGNLGVGNSAELEDVIYQNIPYVGFPRSLGALGVLRSVTDKRLTRRRTIHG